MATANPAMNEAVYRRVGYAGTSSASMTVQGTTIKTAFLLLLLVVAGSYTYGQFANGDRQIAIGLLIAGSIGGLITALVTCFSPRFSPVTAPIYAIFEGLALGAISAVFEAQTHGIVVQAVGLTLGVMALMLFIYGTGIIRPTRGFMIGIVAATGGICLLYLVSMMLRLFGIQMPFIHDSGPIGIGFSVVVVIIASLNLILDFHFIEQGVRQQAPKFMEWYGGFSLLVTLVWMYLEILRLLSKLQDRN